MGKSDTKIPEVQPERPDRVGLGIALILGSALLIALQEAIFKYSSSSISVWQLYVLRSLLLIPALLVIAFIWGEGAATCRQALRFWTIVRAILFVSMYFATYASIAVLPLSTIAAGLYTAPLFVAALSALVVGERVVRFVWLAIALGFAGVLVILRPGTEAFTWLLLMPVLGGLFYALSALVTRSKCRNISPAAIALSVSLALLMNGALFSAILFVWQPAQSMVEISPFLLRSWSSLDIAQWGFVALLALLMLVHGLTLPTAYQSAPTATIATFDYSYLIFATLFGFLFFSEIPDAQTLVGMLMIAVAGVIVVRA